MKNEHLTVFKNNKYPRKKILFLGYNRDRTKLIDFLLSQGCEVHYTDNMIDRFEYDLIVCFGYRKILKSSTLAKISCPIINLHISYLPYNRGAHPNFWSFYDGTQSGVSIHLIDEGMDTGPILFQKKTQFEDEKTFIETYDRLFNEIENLFIENIDLIISVPRHFGHPCRSPLRSGLGCGRGGASCALARMDHIGPNISKAKRCVAASKRPVRFEPNWSKTVKTCF